MLATKVHLEFVLLVRLNHDGEVEIAGADILLTMGIHCCD